MKYFFHVTDYFRSMELYAADQCLELCVPFLIVTVIGLLSKQSVLATVLSWLLFSRNCT